MQTTQQVPAVRAFVHRHAVLVFYGLVFALLSATLLLAGTRAFLGNGGELESEADLGPSTYLLLLEGNLGFALAALLVIAVGFGRAGLRDLRLRVLRWRVGVAWYAVALLTAPLVIVALLGALSLTSEAFRPAVVTADGRAGLLMAGLGVGLLAAFFEELGWTGLVTDELGKRHGSWATGLVVGVPWCVLHWPLVAGTDPGSVPPVLYVTVALFVWPLPYRILMVWVYGRTRSVLIAMLMHLMLVVSLFTLLGSSAMAGVPDLVFNLVFGATLWLVVAAITLTERGRRARSASDPARAQARVTG